MFLGPGREQGQQQVDETKKKYRLPRHASVSMSTCRPHHYRVPRIPAPRPMKGRMHAHQRDRCVPHTASLSSRVTCLLGRLLARHASAGLNTTPALIMEGDVRKPQRPAGDALIWHAGPESERRRRSNGREICKSNGYCRRGIEMSANLGGPFASQIVALSIWACLAVLVTGVM